MTLVPPNEIALRTDKGSYVGGDTIYGSVYVCLRDATPCRTLRLQLRGYEICEYDYQYVEQTEEGSFVARVGHRKAKKDVVRLDLKLVDNPGGLAAGCYCYPFQYQLPHNLPGVFHCRHEDPESGRVWEAIIKYSVGAFIDNSDFPLEPRLAVECPLILLDCIECKNPLTCPEAQTAAGSVRTFFCIHRGEVTLSSRLDRAAYESEQKITVSVDISNEAAVDVSGMSVRLIRVIKLLAQDKSRKEEELQTHTVLDTVAQTSPEGCPKNNSHSCKVTLSLEGQNSVPPTTSGALIKCSYVVDVDVHVPWAPNIEVRQPLLVIPSSNVIWEQWSPPSWVNECVQADVTGRCSVPPDILTSQSFSGIPGFQPLL